MIANESTRCDRCSTPLTTQRNYDKNDVTLHMVLCEKCHARTTIEPGEYAYALKLWLLHDRGLISFKNPPSFWPCHYTTGKPATIAEIVQIAVKNDLKDLPCGVTCKCMNIVEKLQVKASMHTNALCTFFSMEDGLRKKALLLFWWLLYYRKSSNHPDFWPTYEGKGLMSPREMIARELDAH